MNNKTKQQSHKLWIYILLILVLEFIGGSCTESVEPILPADGNVAYINFYNAIEAIRQSRSSSLAYDNMIYINDSVHNEVFHNFPEFSKPR